jgi:hypothetical protein
MAVCEYKSGEASGHMTCTPARPERELAAPT